MNPSVTHSHPIKTVSIHNPSESTYLPIYIGISGRTEEIAKKDTSLWHELGGKNPRISVERYDNRIVVSSSRFGIPLYAPKDIPEKIDDKNGNLALGVFPICENEAEELLFIKKVRGGFWYIPGGLVDTNDKTLWAAGVRELKEETGLQLNEQIEGALLYAYESVTSSRHNLMIFYSAKYAGFPSTLAAADSDEIAECAWFDPTIFWSSYLKEEIKSPPSIRLVFQHYLENKFVLLDSILKSEYVKFKKMIIGSMDNILFDLCFLKLESKHTGSLEVVSLVEETKNMTDNLMRDKF